MNKYIFGFLSLALVCIVGITAITGQAQSTNFNLTGWAWSSNVGWISLNCQDRGVCALSDYKVQINPSDGKLSGYAWSSNIGWIQFNPSGPYPENPQTSAVINPTTGIASGWIRALSYNHTYDDAWDGWIKITDAKNNNGKLEGWAWGNLNVGWINFWNVNIPNINIPFSDPNKPPVIYAGDDRNVEMGKTSVISDATATDPEGDPLTYQWNCYDGDTLDNSVLSSTTVLKPTFTAPSVTGIRRYTCQLTAMDTHTYQGATAHNSATDSLYLYVFNPAYQVSMRIVPITAKMYVGQQLQFNAYFTYQGVETFITNSANWSSAASNIVSVDNETNKGLATAKKVGKTRLNVSYTNPATGLVSQTNTMEIEVFQAQIEIKEVAP